MNEKKVFSEVNAVRMTITFLSVASVALFHPEIVHAAVSFGDIGNNLAENSKGLARGASMFGYLAGTIFGMLGISDLVKASRPNSQTSYISSIWKIVASAGLLGFGAAVGSGSITIFGSDQSSGLEQLGL